MKLGLNWILVLLLYQLSKADDGYRLWLKYDKIQNAGLIAVYRSQINSIRVIAPNTPVIWKLCFFADYSDQSIPGQNGHHRCS